MVAEEGGASQEGAGELSTSLGALLGGIALFDVGREFFKLKTGHQ
jgi:hypothetical protein